MTRILVLIAVLVGLAFAGAWLVERPGEIVMTVEGYRVETSLAMGLAVVAGVTVVAMILWSLLRFLLRIPGIVSFSNRARRRAKGYAAVSRGMVAVGAGDPRSAKRHAQDASRLLGDEPLALLLKAQTAQMTGDRGSAEGAFRQMLDEPETRVLGLRGLFVEARRKGDLAAARAYAAEAARLSPSVSWAGEALLEYQCSEGDWSGALATLERGSRGQDKNMLKRQRAVLLTADAMGRAEREPEAALARAQEAIKLSPDLVPAVSLAARLLSRKGDFRRASKTVEAAWKLAPHPELADAYVHVRPGDSVRDRLIRAERLHSMRQSAAEGRVAVAEAALGARDFDRAKSVLAPLLEGRPPVSVCLLMADLAEADETAHGSVREWLARASRAPRDAAWIADGVISDRWAPVSPITGRLDAFVWGAPVEQIALSERDEMRAERAAAAALPASDDVIADVDEPETAFNEPEPTVSASKQAAGPTAHVENEAEPERDAPEMEAVADPAPERAPAGEPSSAQPAPNAGSGNGKIPPEPSEPAQPEPPRPPSYLDGPRRRQPFEPGVAPSPLPSEPPHADVRPAAAMTEPGESRRRSSPPTQVVFPLAGAPDDPGPDGPDQSTRGRIGFLQ